MRPSQLCTTLAALCGTHQPVFIWGPPGVYKSSVVRQVAEGLKRPLIDVRTVLLDPVDLRGLPSVVNGRAHWCPPSFLPSDPESRAIIFLDELPQSPPMVQAACLQLVLDRQLGEYKLPEGCDIVAAGNRQEDRAGTHRMITPMLNRFVHLQAEVSTDDWQAWALRNGVDARVRAFIGFKPGLLLAFDPKAAVLAFPTPRSWAFVSRCLPAATGPSDMLEIVKGCVGDGAACEFMAFVDLMGRMPDPQKILADPDNSPVPTGEPAVMYALVGALVDAVRNNASSGNAVVKYANRLPAEFGVLLMRDSICVNPAVMKTPEGAAWARKNADVILGGSFRQP